MAGALATWLSQAVRRLLSTPAVSSFTVLSVAAGAAAVSATFSATAGFMWTPIRTAEPERVVILTGATPGGQRTWRGPLVSRADFVAIQSRQTAFASLAATRHESHVVSIDGTARNLRVEAVSGGYFEVLGAVPMAGRLLQGSDHEPASPPVIVLAEGFCRRAFLECSSGLGRTLQLSGKPLLVVGVVGSHFSGVGVRLLADTDAWIPLLASDGLTAISGRDRGPERHRQEFAVLGRVAPGRVVAEALTEIEALSKVLDASAPRSRQSVPWNRSWSGVPASDINTMLDREQSWLRFAVVGLAALLLIVASTNVATLMGTQWVQRRAENAVRMALGAGPVHLIASRLGESVAIAGAAATVAVFLLAGMNRLLTLDLPIGGGVVVPLRPELNWDALMVLLAGIGTALVIFGVIPARRASQVDLRPLLSANHAGAVPRWRGRQVLLTCQVAVSGAAVVLAVFATDVLRKFEQHDSGIDMDRLAVGFLDLSRRGWNNQRVRHVAAESLRSVGSLEGVEAAALSVGLPFGVPTPVVRVAADDTANDSRPDATAYMVAGSASLLPTLAVPILYGRGLDDVDASSAAPVAVVSESLARTLFLSENSVGKSVHLTLPEGAAQSRSAQDVTIVGVARDTDTGTIYTRAFGVVYVALDPTVSGRLTIVARTSGRPDPLIPHLRDQLNRVDPELAVERVVSGRDALAGMFSLVATFGALVRTLTWLTALLSLVGLYGLVTWLVTSSRREIGVRLAVGASGNAVFRSVLMTGLRPVVVGLGVGVPLGLVGRAALGAVYDLPLRASEVILLVTAIVTLCTAALIACLPAARSAAATDACCLLRDAH